MADDDVTALRATAHPLRLQILSLLTGTSMSAAELARELGTTQANASYHLRVLAEAGQAVPDGEVKIRGGTAKRYRHPWDRSRDEGPARRVDLSQHVRSMASELTRRYSQHRQRSKTWFCDAEMWVAPETYAEVLRLVEQASRLIHAEARSPHAAGTVHVNLTVAAFGMKERS